MPARDPKETLRRLVNLGSAMTGITREDVEGFVRDFVSMEGERIERAEEFAEEVFARSRRTAERLGTLVRDEVRRELDERGRPSAPGGDVIDRAVGLLGDLLGVRRPTARERPPAQDAAPAVDIRATSEAAAPSVPPPVPPSVDVAKSPAKAAKSPAKAAKSPAKAAKSPAKAANAPAKAAKSPAKAANAPAKAAKAAKSPATPEASTERASESGAAGAASGPGKRGGPARPAGRKGAAS